MTIKHAFTYPDQDQRLFIHIEDFDLNMKFHRLQAQATRYINKMDKKLTKNIRTFTLVEVIHFDKSIMYEYKIERID